MNFFGSYHFGSYHFGSYALHGAAAGSGVVQAGGGSRGARSRAGRKGRAAKGAVVEDVGWAPHTRSGPASGIYGSRPVAEASAEAQAAGAERLARLNAERIAQDDDVIAALMQAFVQVM